MKTTTKTLLPALMLLAISCTKETLHTPPAASAQTENNNTQQATGHYIGERFGGGIIFAMTKDSLHGLIADTVDLPGYYYAWWNDNFSITGATDTRIGKGRANTRKIIASQGKTGSYAALACARSNRSGYTDWFLPSKDELNELYKRRFLVGGLAYDWYWSSSEDDSQYAWLQYFLDGLHFLGSKDGPYHVRAVRAF